MLTFGLAYEVQESKFWRITKQLCEESLSEVKQDTLALMDTISFMKEAGILSNKALRELSDLVNQLDSLTDDQLVDFTLMFSSSEMQSALDTSEHISTLEEALMARNENFSAEQFATICSVVAFEDAPGEQILQIKLPVFLHANLDRVLAWLSDTDTEGSPLTRYMQDFIHVASAYISMYDQGQVPEQLLSEFERAIKQNALSIDVNQAIQLVQIFQ